MERASLSEPHQSTEGEGAGFYLSHPPVYISPCLFSSPSISLKTVLQGILSLSLSREGGGLGCEAVADCPADLPPESQAEEFRERCVWSIFNLSEMSGNIYSLTQS